MSKTNNDSFKTEMIAEIKRIQLELKIIKKNIVKKSSKKKLGRETAAKKKSVKRKPTRKVLNSKEK